MKSYITLLGALLFLTLPISGKAQVGNPAPDFIVTDTHGDTLHLYEYLDSGKVVVLDFFYTTCVPCQYYSPQVNLAYEKYGCNTGKVIFMSIDYGDTNAEVTAYEQQYNIVFPSVSGLNGGGNGVVNLYGIQGFPTLYVIDSTKKIIEHITPPTLQVFDFRFQQHGILPAPCLSAVHEPNVTHPLQLFPNPAGAGQNIRIRLPEIGHGEARFEILNFMGQTVHQGVSAFADNREASLETAALKAGSYLLRATTVENGNVYGGFFILQ